MHVNQQPVEKQSLRPDGALEVFKIWKTIQGEGPYAGTPAVFVRLSGCNLQCPMCDTDYTSKRLLRTIPSIIEEIRELKNNGLVVITGGEPFRQNLQPLCQALKRAFYKVQVETNGTFPIPVSMEIFMNAVVCSPKTPKLSPSAIEGITHFKYVVEDGFVSDEDGLPTRVLGGVGAARPPEGFSANNIFIQPMDEQDEVKNKRHLEAALQSCFRFGYRFCLQVHKYVGLE